MKTTVYVAAEGHPGARAGGIQPAFRAWSDALLIQHVSGVGDPRESAAAMRASAAVARVEPIALYADPVQVDTSLCFAAMSSDMLRMYFPPSWTEDLLSHLVDRGHTSDVVEELVMPCTEPMVPLKVSMLAEVLAETPPLLISHIRAYFSSDIERYANSLAELPSIGSLSEDWEILIPAPADSGAS